MKKIYIFVSILTLFSCQEKPKHENSDTAYFPSDLDNEDFEYVVFIYQNLVDVPDKIETLKELKHLTLSYNNISKLPDWICSLTEIVYLDVSFNSLISMDQICCLKNLRKLVLINNHISALPDDISNLSKLVYLNLSNNEVDYFPSSLVISLIWCQ